MRTVTSEKQQPTPFPSAPVPFNSCYKSVLSDLEYHYQQREIYQKRKWRYEKYSAMKLVRSSSRGHSYYSVIHNCNGQTNTEFLGNEAHPLVSILKLKNYYEKCLRDIETNISLLEKLRDKYQSLDPNLRVSKMKKVDALHDQQIFQDAGVIDVEAWRQSAYPRSNRYPEQLIHKTMRGEYVRSKSEVIIANALYQAGIPYRYEQIAEFGGVVIAADFIVLSVRRHKLFVWEHFGRMKDPQYQKSYLWKIRKYTKAGLVVGVDLLTTFDDVDGAIDAVTVRRYIEEVIL